MSFTSKKRVMEEGDVVLLFLGYDNLCQVQLKRGRVDQTRYGAVRHDNLIGAQFGVKMECAKGWIYPLQPTAELWTLALPHRTQILYSADISMIVFQLYLKPGSVVVEAGTGSGSLSHALIRSVMPTGRLCTFEFHVERWAEAKREFEQHGLSDFVVAKHSDVCVEGFGMNKEADAVFLDLPAPWECIASAKDALRLGGRICTFSPCIEQVQLTCQALREHQFSDLTTMECLARPYSVHNVRLKPVDFGDAASEEAKTKTGAHFTEGTASTSSARKLLKVETGCPEITSIDIPTVEDARDVECEKPRMFGTDATGLEFKAGLPPLTMQGHTGFLTVASLY